MKKFFIGFITIFIISSVLLCFEYTVQKGDCLWNIAQQYYGNPYMWKIIYYANLEKIEDPNLIYPGQIFYLPEVDKVEEREEDFGTAQECDNTALKEQVEIQLQPMFPKTVSASNFKHIGKIVAGKETKFVYIDYDVVKIELEPNCNLVVGQIVGIYHKGPSVYDLNLSQVKPDQLSLVAKAKVINLQDEILCEIIRAYSPVTIGDLVAVE